MFDDYNKNNENKELLNIENENKKEKYLVLKIALTIFLVLVFTLVPIFFIYYSKDELKFVVVSDVHQSNHYLNKLVKKLSNKKFDYVLFLGDFLKYDDEDDLKDIERMLKKFEEIAPVLYVSGNNDHPNKLYEENCKLDTDKDKTKNLHTNYKKLKDDLYIVGVSGTTPILGIHKDNYKKNDTPFENLNITKKLTKGFPCLGEFKICDEEFKSNLTYSLNKIEDKIKDKNAKIILMTHIGPLYSYTSVQYFNETFPFSYLGSKELFDKFMLDDKIILNLHGHTHPSRGRFNFYTNKTVFNPGALKDSFYATMKVIKKDGKYDIETTLENLD